MFVPGFDTCFVICFAFSFRCFDVRFLGFSIKVLVDEIENCVDAFLGIVLLISFKNSVELSDNFFELLWSKTV